MRLIFFGTPDYVIPILDKLNKYHEIVAVVTQPPKPVGREKILTYSAVDSWAYKKKIPKFFDFNDLPKADLGVCASYGAIIPKFVIDHFSAKGGSASGRKFGILNIHPSLLPKYRGASPIQTTIANQEKITGVTIIKMDGKMDHGPIVSSFKSEILPNDTFETLRVRLFEQSSEFLINLISNYSKNKIKLKPQNEYEATYTKIISKQDGFVDLEKDKPEVIEAKLRAYSPWPGIWTYVQLTVNSLQSTAKKRLKIIELTVDRSQSAISIEPKTVQLEGKKPVSWNQFKSSYSLIF